MEERLSGRFWTVGVSGRSAVVVSSGSPRDRTSRRRSLAGLGPVWREFGGRWGSWWVRVRSAGRLQTAAVRLGVEWLAVWPGRD